MNILVYDMDQTRAQESSLALGEHLVTVVSNTQFEQQIPHYQLVVLDEEIDPELVGRLTRKHPKVLFLLFVKVNNLQVVQNWKKQGVKDVLSYPVTAKKVLNVAKRFGVLESQPIATQTIATPAMEEVAVTAEAQETQQQAVDEVLEQQQQTQPTNTKRQRVVVNPWDTGKQHVKQQKNQESEETSTEPTPSQKGKQKDKDANKERKRIRQSAPEDFEDLQIRDEEDGYDSDFAPTRQEIVAITSARGGVGKSTITYNLAVLAAEMGIRTVIIDCDPRGNMVSISNTKFRYTADQWDKIDPDNDGEKTVMNLLAPMNCGAYLLPSGKTVNGMAGETMEKVIQILRRYFQLILIDCEPRFTPTTLQAYQNANSVIVVTPDDVSSFGRTIEKINQLREVEIDSDKIKLIINRVEKDFSKDEETILATKSRCKVIAKIPNTQDIRKLQKQGRAAVTNPKSSFTKQIKTLLSRVILVPSTSSKKKGNSGGLLGKFFKKSS